MFKSFTEINEQFMDDNDCQYTFAYYLMIMQQIQFLFCENKQYGNKLS